MKRALLTIIVLAFFAACERDFDELKDTDQRSVTFRIGLDGLFSNVLEPSGGDFSMDIPVVLDARHRIRVNAFCYNEEGDLVDHRSSLTTLDGKLELKFRHLKKTKQYQFVFLADVVEYNGGSDFFEVWYQMKTKKLDDFYLKIIEGKERAIENIVCRAVVSAIPDNQEMDVNLSPITYNGYLSFVNTNGVEKVTGAVLSYRSLYVSSLQGIVRAYYPFEVIQNGGEIPPYLITASRPDTGFSIKIVRYLPDRKDSVSCNFQNMMCQPFVVTVDCQNLTTNCVYY